jgi:hypothetical protein
MRCSLNGGAGVAAAGASAAIITILAYEDLKLHYENEAAQTNLQLNEANQKSISNYWYKQMADWAQNFENQAGCTQCCDQNKVDKCRKTFENALCNYAARSAIAFGSAQNATIMSCRIANHFGSVFTDYSECMQDACGTN